MTRFVVYRIGVGTLESDKDVLVAARSQENSVARMWRSSRVDANINNDHRRESNPFLNRYCIESECILRRGNG